MIVSFELAMLAKEKGFDLLCIYAYCEANKRDSIDHILCTNSNPFGVYQIPKNWNQGYQTRCSAPTLDEVQKWLREKHKIHIEIVVQDFSDGYIWRYGIFPIGESRTHAIYNGEFKTFEQALEAGIIRALNNIE